MSLAFLILAAVQTAPAVDAPPKPKRVCKAAAETGTRMPRKICRSADEWEAQRRAQAQNRDLDRDFKQSAR